ncbi:E3 ubiquitin-protein ligase NRDP1, partial [Manacus vitellinus]
MGYDVTRFQGDVDEDLICPICSGVLEEPVQVGPTSALILAAGRLWWQPQPRGCLDQAMGTVHTASSLDSELSCGGFGQHRKGIGTRDKAPCSQNLPPLPSPERSRVQFGHKSRACLLEMPKDELPNHNCIKHLRSVVQQQQTRIAELEKTSAEHKHQLAEQKRDIQLLKAYMRAIRSVNPNLQNLEETIEYNEILEWVNSLQPARVTR